MSQTIVQPALLVWGIGLVFALAALVIVLGEVLERLRRQGNPLAEAVRQIRHIVLPLLALLIALRQVLGFAGSTTSLRVVETLFWLTVVYAGLTLMRNLARFTLRSPDAWLKRLPTLVFALIRAALVLCVAYYLVSGVWQIDISNFFTAVGVGALAISFALQDTLSNLVSGFLLLADRPFKIGDRVDVDGAKMTVKEINWRTTRLTSLDDDGLVIIPNGALGQKTIINYGQPDAIATYGLTANFSYNDPPHKVKRVLLEMLHNQDGLLGPLSVVTTNYGDFAITYELGYCAVISEAYTLRDQLQTQLFYVAKRHGLSIPFPTGVSYTLDDQLRMQPSHDIAALLRAVPLLRALDQPTIDQLSRGTTLHHYGLGERITRQGVVDEGLYIIQSGAVQLAMTDANGKHHTVAHLVAGHIFGELDLLRNVPSPVTASVTEDATVLIIDQSAFSTIIEQNRLFAADMNVFVEERKRAIAALSGQGGFVVERNGQGSWLEMVRRTGTNGTS